MNKPKMIPHGPTLRVGGQKHFLPVETGASVKVEDRLELHVPVECELSSTAVVDTFTLISNMDASEFGTAWRVSLLRGRPEQVLKV